MMSRISILFKNRLNLDLDRRIVYLFVFAFLIRIVLAIVFFVTMDRSNCNYDGNLYYIIAKDIVNQGNIFYTTDHPYKDVVGPITPWLNAATIYLLGDNWLGIFIVNSLISSFMVVIVYKLALWVFDKSTALLAAIWITISPIYLYFIPTPGKDVLMAFFMILIIYIFSKCFIFNKLNLIYFIFLIFVVTLSIHNDERYFILVPILFIFIFITENNSCERIKFKYSFLFLLSVILLMLPWTARNYKKFDRLVIITTRTERITDKIFGNSPRENTLDYAYTLDYYYIHPVQIDSIISGLKTRSDGGCEISLAQRKEMANGNFPHKHSVLESYFSRFKEMFSPVNFGGWSRGGYYYEKRSLTHNIISLLFYGIMLLFSIPGFYLLYNKYKVLFYLLISIITIYSLIHIFAIPYTVWRYRLPLDSLFILTGAKSIVFCIQSRKINLLKI